MAEETLFNKWDSVVAPTRNELVFAGKNKSYGAFELRRIHNRTVAIALFISATAFALTISAPAIIDWLKSGEEEVVAPVDITAVDLTPPPPIDETEPPPPPPPPPVMETVKFTPPVVTDDEVIDEPPPVQTEETPQISTETQEGTGGDEIIVPTEGDALGEDNTVYTFVEQKPEFPGGDAAMISFIQKNVRYPQVEKESGISGTVYVEFTVNKQGEISDVTIKRGVSGGPNLDKEALRVVKSMPNWNPGKQNGRPVIVRFTIPIKFSLR